MLFSRVSIPELSLLCSLAESINSKKKIFYFPKIVFLRIFLYALQQKVNYEIWAFMLFSRKTKFWTLILFPITSHKLFFV